LRALSSRSRRKPKNPSTRSPVGGGTSPGVSEDTCRAVEPIQRIPQPPAEQRLDLDRLARLQEREEAAERLHIAAPGGLAHPARHQRGDHLVAIQQMLGHWQVGTTMRLGEGCGWWRERAGSSKRRP
jgi:hypothetical protein